MYGVQYQQEAMMMGVKDKCSNEPVSIGKRLWQTDGSVTILPRRPGFEFHMKPTVNDDCFKEVVILDQTMIFCLNLTKQFW